MIKINPLIIEIDIVFRPLYNSTKKETGCILSIVLKSLSSPVAKDVLKENLRELAHMLYPDSPLNFHNQMQEDMVSIIVI